MIRILFFVLTLVLGQTSVIAASIFSTEVILDNSDVETERVAKEKAFVDVLIKTSGQSNVIDNPVIQKALPTVNQYITQLAYGDIGSQRSLILGFDDAKIRTLLTQAQSTYWGLPRPEVLFWLVKDEATQRNVIWEQSGSPLIDDLKAQGTRRGLPVLIPVGDFADVTAISIPDLWGGFEQPISDASMRYNPSGVAVVKLYGNQLSWQLFPNAAIMGQDVSIEGHTSGSRSDMFAQMINDISDFYAQRLGVTLGAKDRGAKELQISGLDSAEDFFVVERVLKRMNSVASIHLESLIEGTAAFRLNLLASENIFHNEMMSDSRLRRIDIVVDTFELVIETLPAIDSGKNITGLMEARMPIIVAPQISSEPAIRYQWNG